MDKKIYHKALGNLIKDSYVTINNGIIKRTDKVFVDTVRNDLIRLINEGVIKYTAHHHRPAVSGCKTGTDNNTDNNTDNTEILNNIEDELDVLKQRHKYLMYKIKKYEQELTLIDKKFNDFEKCKHCKEPYNHLRKLTPDEFNLIEEYDIDELDNDSCHKCFREDYFYCEECIKHRLKDLTY